MEKNTDTRNRSLQILNVCYKKINYLQVWPAKVACRKKTLLVRNFWTPHWLDWILIVRQLVTGKCSQSGFSQTHKIGNIGIIANFEFPYVCSFLLSLQYMILVNMKVDISACNRIKFQGCKLHWSNSFLMAQLKWTWQYWHSCIVESLWKTLVADLATCIRRSWNMKFVWPPKAAIFLFEFFTIRRYLHWCKSKLKAYVGKSKINSAESLLKMGIESVTLGFWDLS